MNSNTIQYPENKKTGSYKELWLAGGCFWGTEEYFSLVDGVIATAVGYANGTKENPTYKEVCTGSTDFAETVYIQYNPSVVSLEFLLELYYKSVDPHVLNRQGNDIGTQYRTGIYYTDKSDEKAIENSLEELQNTLQKPVVIEYKMLENFYLAEPEHQEYLKANPSGYCHIPTSLFEHAKSAKEYQVKSKEELKEELTQMQYHVTQEDGTEPPFKNEYDEEFRRGIYVSITTGEPLFLSSDKFNAGCGWPAFSKPIQQSQITQLEDTSRGRIRTEVRAKTGDDHLGHVFEDGPEELGGLRYCINSAALRFIPLEDMEKEGYKDFIKDV